MFHNPESIIHLKAMCYSIPESINRKLLRESQIFLAANICREIKYKTRLAKEENLKYGLHFYENYKEHVTNYHFVTKDNAPSIQGIIVSEGWLEYKEIVMNYHDFQLSMAGSFAALSFIV